MSQQHVSQPTLFQPGEGMEHLSRYLDRIPRFLYRVYSTEINRSQGKTTPTSVAPGRQSNEDVLWLPKNLASNQICGHLTWKEQSSNFVSWTSSFVFAIQFALRKTIERNGWPAEDPSNIQIYILDTRNLPRGSFLSAKVLLEAYDPNDGKLRDCEYYAVEYLSQGCLDLSQNPMTMFTLADLEHDFLELEPELKDVYVRRQLATRVKKVRQSFDEANPNYRKETPSLTKLDLVRSIVLKCCPTPVMQPVLMAALMSFHPRERMDESILRTLRGRDLNISVTVAMLEDRANMALFVAEHKQFIELMYDFHADAQRQRQNGGQEIRNTMDRLDLSSHEPDRGQSDFASKDNLNLVLRKLPSFKPEFMKRSEAKSVPKDISRLQAATSAADTETVVSSVPVQQMCPITFHKPRSGQQEVTLDQDWIKELEQRYAKDTRPCFKCSSLCSYGCFRAGHFSWCTAHNQMNDMQHPCTNGEPQAA